MVKYRHAEYSLVDSTKITIMRAHDPSNTTSQMQSHVMMIKISNMCIHPSNIMQNDLITMRAWSVARIIFDASLFMYCTDKTPARAVCISTCSNESLNKQITSYINMQKINILISNIFIVTSENLESELKFCL